MAASATPSPERLLAVIELQNAIAAAALNADEVMRITADRAALLTGAGLVTVELAEGDDMVCKAASGTQQPGSRRAKRETLPDRCVIERKQLRADDGTQICVPLVHGEHAVGVLTAAQPKAGEFTAEDLETLRILANIIAIPLHRTRSFPRPRLDTQHDPLTGLLNKRAFEERVHVELERRRRYKQSFSLAILDLEGFNTAVDRAGEGAGDQLLKQIGTMLQKHTRVMDAVFRLGGDEFAIIMPGTALEGAKILGERCRSNIEDERIAEGAVRPSIGIVEAGEETIEQLAERADTALRADKASRK